MPANAIVNLSPYRPPKPVTAAGGYVVRPGGNAPEVLVIFRRGVWDLPKGKLDRGETVEACALREVREEIGVADLHLLQPAGTTEHGYDDEDAYAVKTTHWFLMRTAETDFTPQKEEDIEQVAWMPWPEALERIGYDTLRDHMHSITDEVVAALGSP
ncbi:MAG TPA: NUDIX hydrolase [Rhodothermales bacterium]|nr:NUDIX hydrolase [Rhodothermales bacterium]